MYVWLKVAEREVPHRRNCRWCDEFIIMMDMGCAVYDMVYVINSL